MKRSIWIILALVAFILFYRALQRRRSPEPDFAGRGVADPPESFSKDSASEGTEIPAPVAGTPGQVEDDLTLINGIGPVRAANLRDAGITSFESLAGTSTPRLKEMFPRVGLEALDDWRLQAREVKRQP